MKSSRPCTDLPAPGAAFKAKLITLRTGKLLYRVYPDAYGAAQFNPNAPGTRRGRFHPFLNAAGAAVPTLYAGFCEEAALAETVFHNRVGKTGLVNRSRLKGRVLGCLKTRAPIRLADLRGHGLSQLGLRRLDLLEAPAACYAQTAEWARAVYESDGRIQGLRWISRQFDVGEALVLFGDRIAADALAPEGDPQPLDSGSGLQLVVDFANKADIALVS